MNCEQYKQHVLLSESGELEKADMDALSRHLAGCAECRAYKADSRRIASATRRVMAAHAPSGAVKTALQKAAEHQSLRDARFSIRFPALQVLAYAAAILVVVGGWLMWTGGPGVKNGTSVEHIQIVLNSLSHGAPSPEIQNKGKTDEALRHVARQLLAMEGLTLDESTRASVSESGA